MHGNVWKTFIFVQNPNLDPLHVCVCVCVRERICVCLGCIVLQFVCGCIIFKGVVVIIQWYTICEKILSGMEYYFL